MDWGIIAQATFFLAIALLATVITIFVFASSLLGRAIEVQAKEQARLRTAGNKKLDEQLKTAQTLVTGLQKQYGGDDLKVNAAVKSLQDVKKQKHEFDKKSNHLQQGYKVFTVQGGVTYPTCLFLSAMFLSALAWGLGASGKESFYIGGWEFYTIPFLYVLVPAALLLIGFGIGRLLSSLQKIREVAVTSEEIAMRKDVEAFKTAQKELEAEAAPILKAECVEPDSLPIRMQVGDETRVGCELSLISGQIAEDISLFVYLPPGFDFPKVASSDKRVAGSREIFTGYLMTILEYGRLIKGLWKTNYFIIKAPSNIGVFEIKYAVTCRGIAQLPGVIGIEVVPKSQAVQPKISKPKD